MSVNGDASEEVVRLTLEGFEVMAKLSGKGAKEMAKILIKKLSEQKQTKGKTRLVNMIKTGKPLKIFTIQNKDLAVFKQEAKKYGILFCALVDKKDKDPNGITDILVKEEDSSRVNRIADRFKLTTVDTVKMQTDLLQAKEKREEQKKALGIEEKSKEEKLEDLLSNKPIETSKSTETNKTIETDKSIETEKQNPVQQNFNLAKTEKSPQSKPSYKPLKMQVGSNKKPSVKKELAELKVKAKELDEKKTLDKNNLIQNAIKNIQKNDKNPIQK